MNFSAIYVTAGTLTEAQAIGTACVEERLAACANCFSNMQSIYWWEGKLEQSTEAVLILKTRASLVPALIEKVRGMHSYSCPCIVSLAIQDGNPGYLKWIEENTRG